MRPPKNAIMPKTAAIIIIGDEILSGKVQDINSYHLACQLRALGVDVREISVIPDSVDVIASVVRAASETFDFVFTSGGIGPTHDDVTVEGISKGFNVGTVTSQPILEFIKKRCRGEPNRAALKMAELPEGAVALSLDEMFPPIVFRNVYILPGVPELLKEKFAQMKDRFAAEPYHLRKLFINDDECYLADHLQAVVSACPDVMVGSYPKLQAEGFKVVVTLESRDEEKLQQALQKLTALLPPEVLIRTE